MNETGKNIVQQLFGITSLAEVSPSLIEQTTSKYPYFGAAQFLLAKKLKDANDRNSNAQIQKAALHFTNPFWLNYLLHENEIAEADNEIISYTEESFTESSEKAFEKHDLVELSAEPEIEDIVVPAKNEEPPKEIEQIVEADEIVPAIEIKHDEVVVEADEVIPSIEVANDELYDVKDEVIPAPEVKSDVVVEETNEIVSAAEEEHPASTENIDEEDLAPVEEENDNQRLKLSNLIEQHLAEFKKPVEENAELAIKSNPYHTIDYFASQGIKADGQDKFSSRVKKFTDWLKQMKVANSQPGDLGTDTETEQMIETIAQSSNETKDVITETMAEVLVKQGKNKKAIQLYKKLSFLNPSKSTYFAAKIDELNNK
jgi:hypothetical protein